MAAFQLPVFTVSAWILLTVDLSAATSVALVATRGEDFATDRAGFLRVCGFTTPTRLPKDTNQPTN